MTDRQPTVWPILVVAAASVGVSQSFGRFTFSVLFGDVRDGLRLSNTVAGSLGSANLAAYLTGTFVVSLVVGKVGLARVARIGVCGVTVGLGLLAWSPSFVVVLAGLVLTGLFAAGVWVTVPGLVTAVVPAERRGTAIGIVSGGIGVGIVLASTLNTLVGGQAEWRNVYRVEAALAALLVLIGLRWLPGRVDGPAGAKGFAALAPVPGWQRLLVSYGLYGFGMALMITFMVTTLKEDAGYSPGAAALAFSLFGAGTVAGGPLFGPLADRVGRNEALATAFAVMAITALVIQSGARPWATIAAGCFGAAFTGVPTVVAARVSDAVRAESFGAAYGVATLAFGAGLMAAPQVGGLIGDLTGSFRSVYVLSAAVAVVAGVVAWHR